MSSPIDTGSRRNRAERRGAGRRKDQGEIVPLVRLPNGKVRPASTANLLAQAPSEPEDDPLPPGAIQLDPNVTQELGARLSWLDHQRREISRIQVGIIMGEESTDAFLREAVDVAFFSDAERTWKLDVQRGRLLPTPRAVPTPALALDADSAPAEEEEEEAEGQALDEHAGQGEASVGEDQA